MNSSMFIYRLFDVADEINLDLVEALWTSRNKIASRLRLERIPTDSISVKNPPVLVELGSHELEFLGETYLTEIKARIYDIGVISIIINFELPEDITQQQYLDLAIEVDSFPEETIREYIDAVLTTIRPACIKERVSEFSEDFVVYYFHSELPDWNFAPILLKDRTPVSAETTREILSNKFSYAKDIAYLAWDSAIIYDNTGSMDLPDLLEFANAQFLELRYYDNALNQSIDKTYDEIEEVTSGSNSSKNLVYSNARNKLMSIMADISSLTCNIDNALEVTEDIFYARVYSRYMYLLRAATWRENINYKITIIQRIYTLLNEEVTTHTYVKLAQLSVGLLATITILCVYMAFLK